VQKPPIFVHGFPELFKCNDLPNQSVFHGAVKTTANNQWRDSAKSRVQHGRSEGRAVLAVRHPIDWFPVFIDLKSISDFRFVIAIAIPIKNRSGKIADRFSF